MYALIRTGGKMYRVEEGQQLRVEKLEAELGTEIKFDQVLLVRDGDTIKIGTPLVSNSSVIAKVIEHGRHKKISVIKFKRRKKYRRHMGHRQHFTALTIDKIVSN
jgi:large subunit ribosomal protein L21